MTISGLRIFYLAPSFTELDFLHRQETQCCAAQIHRSLYKYSGETFSAQVVCEGCNSRLLELGLSCEEQKVFYQTGEYTIDGKTYREGNTERLRFLPYRCSCDEECVYLGDCCPDYQATCPEMYPDLSGNDKTSLFLKMAI